MKRKDLNILGSGNQISQSSIPKSEKVQFLYLKAKPSLRKTQYKARIDIKMEGLDFVCKKDYFSLHKLKMKIWIDLLFTHLVLALRRLSICKHHIARAETQSACLGRD